MSARIEDYSYLWDGSDPEWVLLRINRQTATLALIFPKEGPSTRDVAAVRAVLPRFAEQPLGQVLAALRGAERVQLGAYEMREAKRLSDDCKKRGLSVELVTVDSSGALPYHTGRKACLLIEDDTLAAAVYEAAIGGL